MKATASQKPSFLLPIPFKEGPLWVLNIRLNSGTKGVSFSHTFGGVCSLTLQNELCLLTEFKVTPGEAASAVIQTRFTAFKLCACGNSFWASVSSLGK